jgi:hypothetical protein
MTPQALADLARRDLETRGWFRAALPQGRSDFEAVASVLGTVDHTLEVVVSPERERAQRAARRNKLDRPSLYQASELDFHTDPPRTHLVGGVDILAFFCVDQDEVGGENLLIDMGHLRRDFTTAEVDALGRIKVAYSTINAEGIDELHTLPLVANNPDGLTLHYMPWGVRQPTDPDLARLLREFERYVREQPVVSVRLEPGDGLFLDNRRLLHGRGPLPLQSRRRMLRFHLRPHPG